MLVTEKYKDNLIRTYSSTGMYIERDGVQYAEAIDIEDFAYVYTETAIPIESEALDPIDGGSTYTEGRTTDAHDHEVV